MDRHQLRTTFEEVPDLYDRARPVYPDDLFDELARLGGLEAGSRVLEIGCGTGKATVPLAERGLEVVCVELGPELAAFARRKLSRFSNVEVVNATFEDWHAPDESFDAVVAFTAFHWIDPEARYAKPARLLREGGAIAVVQTNHVLVEGSDPFWADVQEDYDAVSPSEDNRPPPPPRDVPDLGEEIERNGLFEDVSVRRYLWDVTYSAEEYIAVLDTYSGHRSLDPRTRNELYDRIRRRIDSRPTRHVTKTYLATLNVAQRAAVTIAPR